MKCLKKTHLCIDILGSYYLLINILAKCKIVKPRFLGYAKFQNFLRTLRRQIIKLWLILQLNWSAFIGKLCKLIVKVFKNIWSKSYSLWLSAITLVFPDSSLDILYRCSFQYLPWIPKLSQCIMKWGTPPSVTGFLLTIWKKQTVNKGYFALVLGPSAQTFQNINCLKVAC